MKNLQNLLKSKKTKLLLIILLIFSLFSSTFAQVEVHRDLSEKLTIFLKALSLLWLIPAVVAGKLMTNDWVFGLGMDKYLWYMWNIMKNFANFFIGFMFFAIILYSFFKGSVGAIFKKYLLKLFLAGILINLSWFIILVLLDISLILTYAVGDIPRYILSNKMDQIKSTVRTIVSQDCGKVYILDMDTGEITSPDKIKQNKNNCDVNSFVNKIFGDISDLSGPLVYMGYSVLGILDWTSISADKITNFKDMAVDVLLKFILVISFILPLTVLAIVNFVRIFWIWMFIVFSPFVIINAVFGSSISKKVKMFEKFSFSNMIGLIFMPVAVVGTLSIGMIFIFTFQSFLMGSQTDKKAVKSLEQVGIYGGNNDSCLKISSDSQVCIKYGTILKKSGEYTGGIIGWLILVFFIIFFLWSLLQVGFKASSITAGISDSIFSFAKRVGSALPVLPGGLSVGALGEAKRKFTHDLFGSLQGSQGKKLEDKINRIFGLSDNYLNASDRAILDSALANTDPKSKVYDFFKNLRYIAKNKKGTLSIKDDPKLKEYIEKVLLALPPDLRKAFELGNIYNKETGRLNSGWEYNPNVGRFIKFMMRNLPSSVNEFDTNYISSKIKNVTVKSAYDADLFKVE